MKYSVEITGPALSFLYFASTSKSSANDGLLIGSVEEKQIQFISDSNEAGVKKETIIRISGVHSLPDGSRPVYINGKLNEEIINTLTNQLKNALQPVGWFSCRTNSQFKPSLRETALHSQLAGKFGQQHSSNSFIFVLVQNLLNSNIREFHSKFYQMDNSKRNWTLLTGTILNWNRNTDDNTYRSLPTLGYNLINCSTKENKQPEDGAAVLKGVLKRGNQVLTESLHKISKLTADIGRVEVEISKLQKRVETVDETIFNDDRTTGSDSGTPSPTVSRRRGNQQTRQVETDLSNANSGVFDDN